MGVSGSGRGKFLDPSIGIDKSNTFQLNFISSMKIVGATSLGGLRAFEGACYFPVINLRCVQGYGI